MLYYILYFQLTVYGNMSKEGQVWQLCSHIKFIVMLMILFVGGVGVGVGMSKTYEHRTLFLTCMVFYCCREITALVILLGKDN